VSDQIDALSDDADFRKDRIIPAELGTTDEVSAAVASSESILTLPLDTGSLVALPDDLKDLFDPPLAGDEKRKDFDRFFSAIVSAVRPVDAIAWVYTWDIVCLSWEIKRERSVKATIVNAAQIDFLSGVLNSRHLTWISKKGLHPYSPRPHTKFEARVWLKNPEFLPEVSELLENNGYDRSRILAGAYVLAADNIDAIDRRLASYETRRMVAMRTVENYNEKFAKNLDAVSREVVDAEFKDLPPEDA
jgi:hypothetical protein